MLLISAVPRAPNAYQLRGSPYQITCRALEQPETLIRCSLNGEETVNIGSEVVRAWVGAVGEGAVEWVITSGGPLGKCPRARR